MLLNAAKELILDRRSGCQAIVKWRRMPVTAASHLFHQGLMAQVQGVEPAVPAQHLGMVTVALFAPGDNRPYRVEFAMLAEEMLAAQDGWRNVPHPHLPAPQQRIARFEISTTHVIASYITGPAHPTDKKKEPCRFSPNA